ncbi:hypothetical protein AGMMS49574_11360 [Bacteroidia bacterium]|nr:hypothetical protein AGMMS49574_11360 [Bacteroidia bacterium]
MKYEGIFAYFVFLLLCFTGCINEFIPKGVNEERGFFVVDGTITDGESVFTLSRSVGISEKLTGEETIDNATVNVETNDGGSIPAQFRGGGKYVVQTGHLNPTLQYRLSIAVDGDEFLSEYLFPIVAAEIDSLFPIKKVQNKPVFICVSTHASANSSQYYRWTYHETWEVKAALYANARYGVTWDDIIFHSLATSENTYYCWGRDSSKSLILGTTEKLSPNIISQQKVVEIPCDHDKLSILYHIEVEQMQLREVAYRYFFDMQQKIESTGSLFSPILTTGVRGNIRCLSDPERLIIGYIEVSIPTKKDLFIWEKEGFYEPHEQDCQSYSAEARLPILLLGVSTSLERCVDCRMRENASKNKPANWPTEHL